jgi:hypothetical protein
MAATTEEREACISKTLDEMREVRVSRMLAGVERLFREEFGEEFSMQPHDRDAVREVFRKQLIEVETEVREELRGTDQS